MTRRLGIELLSVFGLNPVAHVHLAADLGCAHISTGLVQGPFNPDGYAPWSLKDDAALRRATIAAMRDRACRCRWARVSRSAPASICAIARSSWT